MPLKGNGSHVVSRGETLYAIAWRYGLEFRKLAAANNIQSPYTIYPGQSILLQEAVPRSTNRSGHSSSSHRNDRAKLAGQSRQASSAGVKQGSKAAPKPTRLGAWQWPAKGAVAQRFSRLGPAHKGIDIRGQLGQPVVAANGGQVVYAGSGLVGYGNLIIIKHDDRYLSAYAHNRRLLAKEGQQVKAGQQIAEIGDTGTNSVKLHFEIRRNGEPVDPLELLPRR